MKLLFNINECVRIRLTPHGIKRIVDSGELYRLKHGAATAPDAEGWSRWQFWELIEMFGPATGMGCQPWCEGNDIEFDDKYLRAASAPEAEHEPK